MCTFIREGRPLSETSQPHGGEGVAREMHRRTPCACQIGARRFLGAVLPPLRGADAERETVPVAGDEEQARCRMHGGPARADAQRRAWRGSVPPGQRTGYARPRWSRCANWCGNCAPALSGWWCSSAAADHTMGLASICTSAPLPINPVQRAAPSIAFSLAPHRTAR